MVSEATDTEESDLIETSSVQVVLWSPATNEAAVCQYDWPCSTALRVEWCESRNRPTATNGLMEGLMQIHLPSHRRRLQAGESLFDPDVNLRVAYEIWSEQGWRPWACK